MAAVYVGDGRAGGARDDEVPGRAASAAGPADIALVSGWLSAFHDEAQLHAPAEEWHVSAERRVAASEVHLWHDGGTPVALAAVSAPAAGVARVGPVYTPPGQRRRGYGAAVTAEATAAALAGPSTSSFILTSPTRRRPPYTRRSASAQTTTPKSVPFSDQHVNGDLDGRSACPPGAARSQTTRAPYRHSGRTGAPGFRKRAAR